MVHRVVAPSTATTLVVVATAVVGLRPTPLRLYPFPALLVSTLLAPGHPSVVPLVVALGLCLALLVCLLLAILLRLRLASLLWSRLHSVATPEIALRH